MVGDVTHPLNTQNHRIIESLRLEKTSKITKYDCQPKSTMPAKLCPDVPYLHVFEHLQRWGLHHFPGQPVPMLDHTSNKEIFPNIPSKPPVTKLEAIACRLITSYLGEETNTWLTTTFFQVVVESNKVSPEPSLLQTEQSQFPQAFLIRLVL